MCKQIVASRKQWRLVFLVHKQLYSASIQIYIFLICKLLHPESNENYGCWFTNSCIQKAIIYIFLVCKRIVIRCILNPIKTDSFWCSVCKQNFCIQKPVETLLQKIMEPKNCGNWDSLYNMVEHSKSVCKRNRCI